MNRILVIGAGLIGSRHVGAVQAHPDCTLAGVVDPNPNGTLAPDIPRFADTTAVDVPVDGAIIATPTGLHCAHGIAAAERGWHMLIEKPVAETVDEADKLEQSVRAHGVHALVGHHRRYHSSVQVLKQVVASGRIGAPITSTMIWSVRKPDGYFTADWRRTGGSPVMINLIHDVDLLRFVIGDITAVTGFGSQAQRCAGRIESGAVALRFANGATGTISFADTAPGPWGFEAGTGENPNIAASTQDMWWITGTRGGISFPSLTLWQGADHWGQTQTPQRLTAQPTVPLIAQLDHFLAVMRGDATPLIGISDARQSLKITRQIETRLSGPCPPAAQDIRAVHP